MAKPIGLDLRRDLPRVRKQYRKLLIVLPTQACDYTAPCVIGAMLSPKDREFLQTGPADGSAAISDIIKEGIVKVPVGQKRDFVALQGAFDSGDQKRFEQTLKRVEAKYLAQVSA